MNNDDDDHKNNNEELIPLKLFMNRNKKKNKTTRTHAYEIQTNIQCFKHVLIFHDK